MKNIKKPMALLLALVLLLGLFPMAASAAVVSPIPPGEFEIVPGVANDVDWDGVLDSLAPGEVWTDKSVYYPQVGGEYDGTAVITVYIWGKTFSRPDGSEALLGGDQQVLVATNIGDFQLGARGFGDWEDNVTTFPAGITVAGPDVNGRMTWSIHEDFIIDEDEPLRVWYHLYLDEGPLAEDWKVNFWYSTAGDYFEIRFEPSYDNPVYWTREEETSAEFTATINWNNGTGLNSATIRDNVLGITISFDKNVRTPTGQTAGSVPFSVTANQQYWTQNARVAGVATPYYWHLQWVDTTPKFYTITVRNLTTDAGGIPIDVVYVLDLDGAGGNSALAAGRFITSETYFRRTTGEDGTVFEWDEQGRLIFRTALIAQIMLHEEVEEDPPLGTLQISKEILGLFDQEWYFMDGDWFFTVRLRAGNNYVSLTPTSANTYEFSGYVGTAALATTITFTNTNPTFTITELPIYANHAQFVAGIPLDYYLYEFFTFETLDLITVNYRIGPANPSLPDNGFVPTYPDPEGRPRTFMTGEVNLEEEETVILTIQNIYDHGIGFVEVHKLLDGFPSDWYVDNDTEFYVRLWDMEAENYILFYPRELYAGMVGNPSYLSENPIFDGSYWAVGNHALGLTDFYPNYMIPILELPVSVYKRLRMSNLWTGIHYEVREVRRVDDTPAGIAAANLAWATYWDTASRLPVWIAGGNGWDATWIEDVWLGGPWDPNWLTGPWTGQAGQYWEYVRPVVTDSAWHAVPIEDWHWGVIYNHDDNPTPHVQFNLTSAVTLTNRYKFHGGEIKFVKELCDYAVAWGVDEDDTFYARVRTDDGRLLVFVPHPAGQTQTWRVIGFINESTGVYQVLCPVGEAAPPASARTILPFSGTIPAKLIEVPVHPFTLPANPMLFTIEEVFPAAVNLATLPLQTLDAPPAVLDEITFSVVDHLENDIEDPEDGFPMIDNETMTVTITNSYTPAYRVLYNGNGNTGGTAPVDPNNPYFEDDEVTVLPVGTLVRAGHAFTGWNTAANGSGTTYQAGNTFDMPANDVTLFAQWTPTGGGNGGDDDPRDPPTGFFVDEHIWYLRGYDEGPPARLSGVDVQTPNDFTMRPNNNITRAEVAMAFYRLLRPEFKNFVPDSIPYTDVNGNEWFGRAVGILTYHDIFEGNGGLFRPHAPITRRELASVVSRFDTMIDTDENPYSDVFSDDWAYRYILSATARGWFIGFPDGTFKPETNLTRAEFATAVNRVLERKILLEHIPDDVVEFIDLDGTHWAHADFMEAAHSHDWEPHENGISERWLEITGHGLDAAYNE